MNRNWRQRISFFILAAVLSLGLFGCGNSESEKKGTEVSKSQETSDSGEQQSSETDEQYEALKELYDVGRMGVTDGGGGVFFASTTDGSNCLLVFVNPDTAESGSFVGPATVSEDGSITITDESTGYSITFTVTDSADGLWLLNMEDLGEVVIAECTVSECIDALKAIDEGTTPQF